MRFKLLAAVGIAWQLGAASAAPAPLTYYMLEYPPFVMQGAARLPARGIAYELVLEAFHQAGVATRQGDLPWKRAQMQVSADDNSCLFPLTRSPKREALYRWVALINEDSQSLYVKADFEGKVRDLEDLKRLRIVTLLGSSMAEWLKRQDIPFAERDTPEAAYRELSHGVADAWAVHRLVARYLVKQQGLPAGSIREVWRAQSTQLYLACSPKLPEDAARRIAAAMQRLRDQGEDQRLVAKYLN
ncbi:hypothetical protein CEK28_11300 [Xenophilus sp. AP218F]|nr:transporter substrate-binding domain-containing protein [Chromobacterium sp. ASV5]OWY38676.1 hypothetical protein CEK28_11300 [Xenophilus sp. AP218F]